MMSLPRHTCSWKWSLSVRDFAKHATPDAATGLDLIFQLESRDRAGEIMAASESIAWGPLVIQTLIATLLSGSIVGFAIKTLVEWR